MHKSVTHTDAKTSLTLKKIIYSVSLIGISILYLSYTMEEVSAILKMPPEKIYLDAPSSDETGILIIAALGLFLFGLMPILAYRSRERLLRKAKTPKEFLYTLVACFLWIPMSYIYSCILTMCLSFILRTPIDYCTFQIILFGIIVCIGISVTTVLLLQKDK